MLKEVEDFICFEYLNCNSWSWNWKCSWSNKKNKNYYIISWEWLKEYPKEGSYHYDFWDWWSCNIRVEIIDLEEKYEREFKNDWFLWREWMCESIIKNWKILKN